MKLDMEDGIEVDSTVKYHGKGKYWFWSCDQKKSKFG